MSVVRHILGKDPVEVSLAEDRHAVGECGSGWKEIAVPACRGR
jgi:hypothetical protein